jgi:ketosteroid isomerase-like protein
MTERLSADDQIAIRDVISHYAWALDTGNVEAFVSCYTRDGVLIWDAFEEPLRFEGVEALRHFATFIRDQPASAGRQHHVTNVIVTPCEGGARAISYGAVALRQGDGPHSLHVMGYYEDIFRKEDGAWRMAERVIRDWSGPILAGFAGQTGEREARPLPPPLRGLIFKAQK